MLPFHYVLRNLQRRSTRSLVTVAGIAATTLLVIAMEAFATSMHAAAGSSARPDAALLLGISAEVDLVRSVIARGNAEIAAAAAPGVMTVAGQRAASVELHIATRNGEAIGLLRGVTPAAYLVHEEVQVVEGREPRLPQEIMVGALAGPRMGLPPEALAIGKTLHLERTDFTIVGRFAAPGTNYEAELWAGLQDVMNATRREDVSCVAIRLESPEQFADLSLFANRRLDLEIAAMPETELHAALASSLVPIAALARWLALLAIIAGAFACANTMFAAVLSRTRELATLRALGYSPAAVALALLQEALLVAFVGGAIGVLMALACGDIALRYPMGALRLRADLDSRALGLAAALVSGLLGGMVPAWRAVRLPLIEALSGRT
jgi:ABC-type lipoprotein release transport system permease subunit